MTGHPSRSGWFYGSEFPCDPVPPPRQRPYRLVLLGPPGVGKGTQAEMLCEKFRACHLSTGDLFRAAKCESQASPAMKTALAAMQRGELVSDDLVVSLVRERAACLRCHGGFLLDGFPRTVGQAESLQGILEELQVDLDGVLAYEMPLSELVARLSGRRTCSQCKTVYHIAARPPRKENVCDQCGEALFQRDDDREEAIRVRLSVYEKATGPLVDYYQRRGKLMRITAYGTPDQVFQRSMKMLARAQIVKSYPEAIA